MKEKKNEDLGYREMPVRSLVNYIIEVEHPYMKKSLGAFVLCSQAIINRDNNAISKDIKSVLLQLQKLVQQHFEQDELVLIPFLTKRTFDQIDFTEFPLSLKKVRLQHHEINRLFRKLRKLSGNYIPPKDSTPSFKLCYAQLFNFEQDMLKHTLLEEDILFPKMISGTVNH